MGVYDLMNKKDSNLDAKKAIGLLFFMCPVHIMLNTVLYLCVSLFYIHTFTLTFCSIIIY